MPLRSIRGNTIPKLALLQAEGCDERQGFHFSRAVPALEFIQLLDAGVGCNIS